jgi:UDP-N-acetyl-D-mannosaminuronate dehydrogenase
VLMGVAYKNDVDDVRQAPSREIAPALVKKGADLLVHDPWVNDVNLAKVHQKTERDFAKALKGADAAVFLVAHSQFKKLKPADVPAKVIVDAAYLFDAREAAAAGKIYRRVGLGVRA